MSKYKPVAERIKQTYYHRGEEWVVGDWQKIAMLFKSLTPDTMEALHALAVSRVEYGMPWYLLCRLISIRSRAELTAETNTLKHRPMSIELVAQSKDMNPEEVQMHIAVLQAAWERLLDDATSMKGFIETGARTPGPAATSTQLPQANAPGGETTAAASQKPTQSVTSAPVTARGTPQFTMDQIDLLALGSFSTSIFDWQQTPADRRTEIEWFCDQIQNVRKVFEEPMAKELARLALLNLLHLRRINERLVTIDPGNMEFSKLQGVKNELEEQYGKQWAQVAEVCPVAIQQANRKTAVNNLADLVKIYQQYHANPDNRPRDGVFTDDELQVLFRTSVQDPDPRYRLGWVAAMNEAKVGINDPQWRRKMTNAQCRILDAGFAYAAKKLIEQEKVNVPDLESEGPEGEYDPIHTEATGGITDGKFEDGPEKEGTKDTVEIV